MFADDTPRHFSANRPASIAWWLVAALCAAGVTQADETTPSRIALKDATRSGRQFLVDLVDDSVQLLPEFSGHHVYWLYHDNYLVAKTLDKTHPKVAKNVQAAIDRYEEKYSGKIEIVFGEADKSNAPLPFRHHDLVTVQRVGDRVIKTERRKVEVLRDWERYADLLFLATMATMAKADEDPTVAAQHLQAGMKLWNGVGFHDVVAEKSKKYATYKLALAILAHARLGRLADVPEELTTRLMAMQDDSGGWTTDYDAQRKPLGKQNVETTCLAILALDELAMQHTGH